MNRRRVPAVDEVEPSVLEVEPRVAHGHEALELDQLPGDLRVRQRHDLLRFGQRSRLGQRNQAAERLEEVALGCRAQQRRGDALAHDVADDDVEAVSRCLKKS